MSSPLASLFVGIFIGAVGGTIFGAWLVYHLLEDAGDLDLPEPDQIQDFFKAKGRENQQ